MQALWDSIDKLSRLNTLVLACAAVFGFLAAGFVVASWFTGTKLAALQDRELDRYKKDAGLRIANANEVSAKANERAGKLEKEAAELTTRNLALEAAIAPRRLSDRQQNGLATLTKFANRTVGIKSYSSDTEGLVLASQIVAALSKSKIRIEDNRLTMLPTGSVSFGISVEGTDKVLVEELKKIFLIDGNLMADSSIQSPNRGFSAQTSFGVISGGTPPAVTITVGVKPLR